MQDNSASPKKPTRCAIYTRVSTDMQAEVEFNSCEAQEDRVRSFIASQEGFQVFKVYTDPGYSGATLDRPAMQELIRDVAAGLVNMVITYKIDRLTRSPRDFYQLVELFENNGASFISVTERFDTSTPSGRLLRNIMLTFAQFERELASERVKDKVIQRVQRGLYLGGRPPFGYKGENGKLVLDPPRDRAVRLIFDTYIRTRSITHIAALLKEKGIVSRKGKPLADSSLWHLLQNPILAGQVTHKGKVYPGQHPAIISKELFEHVQKLMAEAARCPAESLPSLPFAGLIHCKHCGYVMTPAFADKMTKSGPRRYHYYRCSNISREGWDTCPIKEINAERFHSTLYQNILRISRDSDYLSTVVRNLRGTDSNNPGVTGIEPLQDVYNLTPQNLKKALEEFLTICARRAESERILAIRQQIRRINYSKTMIMVEFNFCRPPDGKSTSEPFPSSAALRAAPPARTSTPNRKGSNRFRQLNPVQEGPLGGGAEKMGWVTGIEPATFRATAGRSNR